MCELYNDLKAAGCELDNHDSDLYVRFTPVAEELLTKHRADYTLFLAEGVLWADVPFAYYPFWEHRRKPR